MWVSNVKIIFFAVDHRLGQNPNSTINEINGFVVASLFSTVAMVSWWLSIRYVKIFHRFRWAENERKKTETKLNSVMRQQRRVFLPITKYAANCVLLRPLHMDGNRGMSCLRLAATSKCTLHFYRNEKCVESVDIVVHRNAWVRWRTVHAHGGTNKSIKFVVVFFFFYLVVFACPQNHK